MKCETCGSDLLPFNFLVDDPQHRHHYSKARLVGFTNPKGWRCTNRLCRQVYTPREDNTLIPVEASEVRYDRRDDLGEEWDIWQIVDEWTAYDYAQEDMAV